ncbi:MAG: (deoxy)nucleoside triphosphate pyrophosphohydrolase [Pseudomonadota bacterium]
MAKTVYVAAGALIDRDGRVLLAQRPDDKSYAGLWEFPGGKVKIDERPGTALARELKEELGIDTDQSCFAPFGFATDDLEDIHILILLFLCRKWTGTPTALEQQTLKWVEPETLHTYPMPPPDRPLAAQLRDLLCFNA